MIYLCLITTLELLYTTKLLRIFSCVAMKCVMQQPGAHDLLPVNRPAENVPGCIPEPERDSPRARPQVLHVQCEKIYTSSTCDSRRVPVIHRRKRRYILAACDSSNSILVTGIQIATSNYMTVTSAKDKEDDLSRR